MTKWKNGKPPQFKTCNKCGLELDYANDFYQTSRIRERGLVWYAMQPCIHCFAKRDRSKAPVQKPELTKLEVWRKREERRRYDREYRRIQKKLITGRTVRSLVAPKREQTQRLRLDVEPFWVWIQEYLRLNIITLQELCDTVGVARRTVDRAKADGYIQVDTAEKFFVYAGCPELLQVFYTSEGRAA